MLLNCSGRGRNFLFRGGPWFFATAVAVLIFLSLVLDADASLLFIYAYALTPKIQTRSRKR